MGEYKTKEFYDKITEGEMYTEAKESGWFNLWNEIADRVTQRVGSEDLVVDLGCGPGRFAKVLRDRGHMNYLGLDFSVTFINEARRYNDYLIHFFCEDIFSPEAQKLYEKCKLFVCSETLEHLEKDLDLFSILPKGARIILSVPNFDAVAHVRSFVSNLQVMERYSKYVEFDEIKRVDVYPTPVEATYFYLCSGTIK